MAELSEAERYRQALASGDPRMSTDGPTRWAAVRATKTRCRNCYDDIVQLQPDGWWVDVESETPTCTRNIHHQPLRSAP